MSELVRAVERAGVPRGEFLRAARIEPSWLESDDVRLRREDVFASSQVALDLTRDPAFGLHWGEWLAANAFNLVSHLLVHASNLRQALATLQRFGHLVADDVPVELLERGDTAELRSTDTTDQPPAIVRLNAEMLTLGIMRLLQHFGGTQDRIARVCFAYPAPEYRPEYARIFGGTERFDQPFTGLSFDRALLDARSPQEDEDLYETLADLAARRLQRLKRRAPYAVRVREYLVQQRSPHRVAMPQAARALGLSTRSLHRRLTEEDQSYAALAAEAAARLARRLLLDEGRTSKETAHVMGFANVSSFHRAFRRWTGTTPGALRAQGADPRARRTG